MFRSHGWCDTGNNVHVREIERKAQRLKELIKRRKVLWVTRPGEEAREERTLFARKDGLDTHEKRKTRKEGQRILESIDPHSSQFTTVQSEL